MDTPSKDTLVELLQNWIKQKPGLEFCNYGDRSSYFSEMRSITKQRHDAETLLRSVEWSGITADELLNAFRAFSGRLEVKHDEKKGYYLSYCTGQYFPTEYRAAACAVLARALWDYHRPDYNDQENAGDKMRAMFRRMFGRGIQSRWLD